MGAQPAQLPFPIAPSTATLPLDGALPPQPSLEQLKKQAKDLLAAVRLGDGTALARMARYFPVTGDAQPSSGPHSAKGTARPTLAQTQLVIARELGFPSWTRLRQAVALAPLRAQMARLTERGWIVRRDVFQALVGAGPAGMQVALEGLAHADSRIRRGAVDYLDHVATDACVPQLAALALHDPAGSVRRRAVHALSCERCKTTPLQTDTVPVLLQAFQHDPVPRVRFTAAQSLYRHVDMPQVRAAFQAAMTDDPSGVVRRAAIFALTRTAPAEARQDLLPALLHAVQHDPDARVRTQAAKRLATQPRDPRACAALEVALRDDPNPTVQYWAHQALRRQSPEYREMAAQRAREANLARGAALLST